MKRLLFLLVCALLLILAIASPAPVDPVYYQVNAYDGSAVWADDSLRTFAPVRTVPAGADVRVGLTLMAMNHGGAASQAEAFLFRLTVTAKGSPTPIRTVDESTSGSFWGAPYAFNPWTTDYPDLAIYPYNLDVGADATARDWLVPMPSLPAGRYVISFGEKLTRTIVDPLYLPPSIGPGKKGPWDWQTYGASFSVK